MKIATILAVTVLATATFTVNAADKAPVLMTDAQMKEVVAGTHLSGPGFGICTAVGKADAPGAIKNFGAFATLNLPGNGNLNAKGLTPGFGQQTAGKAFSNCAAN